MKLCLLNQVTGPLFSDLAADLSKNVKQVNLISGNIDESFISKNPNVTVVKAPKYNRKSNVTRAVSWLLFFAYSIKEVAIADRKAKLIIVSNPPFLGAIGLIFHLLRKQEYYIVIYDLYPGMLVNLEKIRSDGIIQAVWRKLNKLVWSKSKCIFTLSSGMKNNIVKEYGDNLNIKIIPVWADTEVIKPLERMKNPFAIKHNIQNKFVVMYSGNLGNSTNLDGILYTAEKLKFVEDIKFIIIGSGSHWESLNTKIDQLNLENIMLLPFQNECLLPFTLSSSDVSVVSMDKRVDGFLVPSKTFYYMAAGSAVLALVPSGSEIAKVVKQNNCGVVSDPEDYENISNNILELYCNKDKANMYKKNARYTAVNLYSRKNTSDYINTIVNC